jgi:hypothetical protein
MSANEQAERKSFRGAIKRRTYHSIPARNSIAANVATVGKKISKVASRPFKRTKIIETSTSSDEEYVPPYRVVSAEYKQQRSTQRSVPIPQLPKSRTATPIVTTVEPVIEEKKGGEQDNERVEGNEMVLWQPSPPVALKQAAAQPKPATFYFATNNSGESIIVSRDITALPWSDKHVIASIQALVAGKANADSTANTHFTSTVTSTSPLATITKFTRNRLHTDAELVDMAARDVSTPAILRATRKRRTSPAMRISEFGLLKLSIKPQQESVLAVSSRIAGFKLARAQRFLPPTLSIPKLAIPEIEEIIGDHPLFGPLPAPKSSSDSESPHTSAGSSIDVECHDSSQTEHSPTPSEAQSKSVAGPTTTSAEPPPEVITQQFTTSPKSEPKLLTSKQLLSLLSKLPTFRHIKGDLRKIWKAYPPNGFCVQPEIFEANEEELRGRRKPHIRINYADSVPDFLPGLIGEDLSGVLVKNESLCPAGMCTHIENSCWPACKFFDLGKLISENKVVMKNGDELHIALNVVGPVAFIGHPPYGEVEIYAQKIVEAKILEKNMVPTGMIRAPCQFTYGMESRFTGCPIFIHINQPMPEMVLDYRIQDIIRPFLESVDAPTQLEYHSHKNGAAYHRAKFAKHYCDLGLLGQILHVVALPNVSSEDEEDTDSDITDNAHKRDLAKWSAPIDDAGGFECYNAPANMMADYHAFDSIDGFGSFMWKDRSDLRWIKDHANRQIAIADMERVSRWRRGANIQLWEACKAEMNRVWWANCQVEHQRRWAVRKQMLEIAAMLDNWDDQRPILEKLAEDNAKVVALDADCPDLIKMYCHHKGIPLSTWEHWREDTFDYVTARRAFEARPFDEAVEWLGPEPAFAYDLNDCMCDSHESGNAGCYACYEKQQALANAPRIVDWVDSVEVNRVDGMWQGEPGNPDLEEDVPGHVRTPAEEADRMKILQLYSSKLDETMDKQLTREQGGVVRWAPAWLSTTSKQQRVSKEIELGFSGPRAEVIAHAVSSIQNLEVIYRPVPNTLTLVADKIGTFEVINQKASGATSALCEKADKEDWWRPDLAAHGIPCNLTFNLPIVKVTIDNSAPWSKGKPHASLISHRRVDPGFAEGRKWEPRGDWR